MSTELIVSPQWLSDNFEKVKIIDASQVLGATQSFSKVHQHHLVDFDELSKKLTNSDYQSEHIPGAVHFNLDIGYFPSEYIKYDLYPPEIFQKYLRLLGINNSDHVLIYGRGAGSGMLFAARVAWTFQVYGLKNISILDGGIDAWKAIGGKVTNQNEPFSLGDFSAQELDKSILGFFEDIPFNNFHQHEIEYLDSRTTPQFTGEQPLSHSFPGTTAVGSHVTGARSLPISSVIGPNGFKTKEEVDQIIEQLQLDKDQKIFVACNRGIQASVIFTALARSGLKTIVYNGSMQELAFRAPQYVNATGY